ncbi:MAG: cytochrome c biogenesis protein ResB [Oscillospiraceae bacterium]|nr:cytochrome c biogenesis protein ResB [Oscillospiraceae bacterium]
MLKKLWKFLSSMQFAIILLLILIAACAVGSFIPQGQPYEWYAAAYSERSAALIVASYLDDVYHSWWFLLITGFLCFNLLLCNIVRLPQILRRVKSFKDPESVDSVPVTVSAEDIEDPEAVFRAMGMPKPVKTQKEGRGVLFSASRTIGFWGAWVCHIGILLLILGFGLGQMTHQEYSVYGVAGQTKAVADTNYLLSIDDFTVDLRDDDTVEQYTAAITVRNAATGEKASSEISVNNPATLLGLKCYQNSTGWAAAVTVFKGSEELQKEVLCAGEYMSVEDMPGLAVYFNAFYPDYVLVDGVGPATASSKLVNPAYLYTVYYQDQVIGMNALEGDETIKIDDYEVKFSDPQNYTVIQIKRDRFTSLALIGGITTMLGLILAFYFQPRKLWAVKEEGRGWTVSGLCQKGGVLFAEQFREAAGTDKEEQNAES